MMYAVFLSDINNWNLV